MICAFSLMLRYISITTNIPQKNLDWVFIPLAHTSSCYCVRMCLHPKYTDDKKDAIVLRLDCGSSVWRRSGPLGLSILLPS